MSALSDDLEAKLADHILGGTPYTKPSTVYIAVFTVAPTDADTGTEATGGSYARVGVTNNATNWPNYAADLKSNGTAITFPTATGSWGSIISWGIYDAITGGNLMFHGALTTARSIVSGDTPSFAIAEIGLTFD